MHSVLFLFWLSSFLLSVLCCLCNRWMLERKSSLLSRAPTLQELSHSRQAVNTGQDTCRLLQPTSQRGAGRLLTSSWKHSPTPSYYISRNIHAPKVFLNSLGTPKYLGYFHMIRSMSSPDTTHVLLLHRGLLWNARTSPQVMQRRASPSGSRRLTDRHQTMEDMTVGNAAHSYSFPGGC